MAETLIRPRLRKVTRPAYSPSSHQALCEVSMRYESTLLSCSSSPVPFLDLPPRSPDLTPQLHPMPAVHESAIHT
ncbi:hypothetical protein BDZ85DRAFT_263038 [Elsinoe ampelina]|uniref:Uncharacterized protein n=1 Tax=Elsinoe ampelina TaxID=302913 RepID=A0A6A6GCN3_9PEZI|nr:hypothetical protein BDZ85DRAFT_263038 [Elsinoe ampelina]